MSSSAQIVILVSAALVILVAFGWWLANRMKRDVTDDAGLSRVGAAIEPLLLTAECAEYVRSLSKEPLLLKQTPDGLRVQIDNRPVVPVALFVDKGLASALMEMAMLASKSFGPSWVALATLGDDDRLSLRRLS